MKGTRIALILALAVMALLALAVAGAGNPVVAVCQGSGGYDGGTWSMRQDDVVPGIVSNCVNTVSDPRDPTTCEPGVPPLDPFQIILETLDCPAEGLPVGNSQNLRMTATGDFACGSGTLTSTGPSDNQLGWLDGTQGQVRWQMDWTASFSNGIGQLTGTASNPDTGETRGLSGAMVIADGAPVACDDSAGAQVVIVALALS